MSANCSDVDVAGRRASAAADRAPRLTIQTMAANMPRVSRVNQRVGLLFHGAPAM